MASKRYKAVVEKRPEHTVSLKEASTFVKEHATAKFDETIELHVRLGVDPKQSDQSVRATVTLPHGAPTSVRIAVFTNDPALQDAAKAAGAELVGGKELIQRVLADKNLPADVAVTTPDTMKDLALIAKILGPRGLMPNPKSGTIGADPAAIVTSLKGGKVNFKMDESANIHVAIAKASWGVEKIEENGRAVIDAIKQARPLTAKGDYILSMSMSSTMGPGVGVRS